MPETLSIAVCIFPLVTALDYQGPLELLGYFSSENLHRGLFTDLKGSEPKYEFRIRYVSHTLERIEPSSGPGLVADMTYEQAGKEDWDIVFVPGGFGARPERVHPDLTRFLQHAAPKARYVLSVCTGSWILAGAGVLDGRRATTNKRAFKTCKASTSEKIDWVPKARWVVDGNIWTSSGVTAGMDMANAFLIHLVGDDLASKVRNVVELTAKGEADDEFAEVYGLV